MNFNLTEDQKAFQSVAKEFAERELLPHAAKWDEEKIFPKDVIKKSAELGFCGLYIKQDVGGLEASRLDTTLIFEELSKACPSTTAYISIHNMVTWMIDEFAKESVRKTLVPKMVSGKLLGSYCLTEPWSGSDAAGLKTQAKKQGDRWILNGTKCFVSGGKETEILVVMTRTGEAGPKGITSFIVPADSKGISYGKNENKMGWNSQTTRIINFDQVEVPEENQLGDLGQGFKIAMQGLNGGRVNIGTCSVGAAQSAIEHSQKYMKERKQFGKSLSEFQALRFKLADMVTHVVASRQMIRLAASKLDEKDPQAPVYCAMAKRLATDLCFDACNEAIQIFGGYGYMKEYPVERLMRDTRVHQILEGTNEIMKVIISKEILEKDQLNF